MCMYMHMCIIMILPLLHVQELLHPDTREHALMELSKKREVLPELAPLLWHSFGTMAALLQEIVLVYPVIHPPTLTVSNSRYSRTQKKFLSVCITYMYFIATQ